jgi:hypothetical protein
MEYNQDRQYKNFEEEWDHYIGDYETQSNKKVKQTI